MYSFKLRQCSVISCTAVQWLGAAARFHPQFVGQLCCESVRVSITDRDENITYCEQLLWLARLSSFLSPHWFPVFLPMLPWPRATAWVQSAAWSELGGSGTSSSQCQHCVFFLKTIDSWGISVLSVWFPCHGLRSSEEWLRNLVEVTVTAGNVAIAKNI